MNNTIATQQQQQKLAALHPLWNHLFSPYNDGHSSFFSVCQNCTMCWQVLDCIEKSIYSIDDCVVFFTEVEQQPLPFDRVNSQGHRKNLLPKVPSMHRE
jgi:hypothetical protein